jgi:D-psicose/D-tagatose/L-ribulose 3-epimerase
MGRETFRRCSTVEMDAAASIELEYSPQPDKIEEWVAEAYRETDKLLTVAGLRG